MCYYYTGATNLVSMPQFEHVDNLKVRSVIGRAIWLVIDHICRFVCNWRIIVYVTVKIACTWLCLVEILYCYSYNYSLKGQCIGIAVMQSSIISQPVKSLTKRFISMQ